MKKSSVIFLIIGSFLFLAGAVLSLVALAQMDFNMDFFEN